AKKISNYQQTKAQIAQQKYEIANQRQMLQEDTPSRKVETLHQKIERFKRLDISIIRDLVAKIEKEINTKKVYKRLKLKNLSLLEKYELNDLLRTYDALYTIQLEKMVDNR
ncbi:MAG: hypothetical protein HON90_01405, partial [Halobacteriovoraceae bacterium]|nr:hypothetical protein [Halobacteriovoraceae bacterium]